MPAPPADNWLTDNESSAWRAYVEMNTRLIARLNRDLVEQSNISDADYAVLVNLSEAPDGRMRAFELGKAMQWEKSRLSHHLTRMERRQFVRREACATDARGAFVELTDRGWVTIRAAAPQHVSAVRRFFIDALTPAQLATLATVSEAVVAQIDRADAGTSDESSGCAAVS